MAMDGMNITEDTEMADCEADKVVTMVDVLQEQQDFEEDANAVLGASDANNCTYSQGYIKRQAIYACLTCCPESKNDPDKRAGVCLACSLNCHEHHDLIELYTKRNFRCDCGNPKFNSNPCQFITNKDDLNSNNMYNHNFSGLYCTCKRPYPDPEATADEDMIQCIICEDWLHSSHLNAVIPPNDQYSEMICKDCMDRNEFLHDYSSLAVNNESLEVDVITVNGDKNSFLCNGDATNEAVRNGESDKNSGTLNGVDVDMVENESNPNNEKHSYCDEEINNVPALKESLKETTVPKTLEKTTDSERKDKITNTNDETSNTTEASKEPAIEEQKETTVEETNKNSDIDKTDDKLLENQLELKDDKTEITLDNDADNTKTDNVNGETDELKIIEQTIDNDIKTDSENSLAVTETQKENVDKDSADAVMDALNELLDDPKDRNNKIKDINEQACEESTNNKDDTNSTDLPENAIDNEKPSTDIEMTDNKSIEEQADTESDKKDSIQTADYGCAETDKEMTDSKIDEQLDMVENKKHTFCDEEINNVQALKETSIENIENDAVMEADSLKETPVAKTLEKTTDNESEGKITNINGETSNTTEASKEAAIKEQKETTVDETNKNLVNGETEDLKTNEETIDNDVKTDSENNLAVTETQNVDKDSADAVMDALNELLDDPKDTINEIKDKNEQPCEESTNNKDDTNSTDAPESAIDNEKPSTDIEMTDNKSIEEQAGTDSSDINITKEVTDSTNEHKRKLSTDIPDETCKKAKLDIDKCTRPKGVKKVLKGATFWPPNFRQLLCTCGECISMYKDLQVLFLTDLEDTVSYYESLGKQKVDAGASQYERGLEALSSLDRMQQINALTEYNNMRDRLLDFLKSFKDRQEVVKEEDIRTFFAGMKPRREPDGVYFCR